MLDLRFCARAFSSCGERGPLFIAVRGPLTIVASLVAEHRLQTRRLSSCGSRAQLLRGIWDLPRPGLEPVSPALAGRFSTTAPPGKPLNFFWIRWHLFFLMIEDHVSSSYILISYTQRIQRTSRWLSNLSKKSFIENIQSTWEWKRLGYVTTFANYFYSDLVHFIVFSA